MPRLQPASALTAVADVHTELAHHRPHHREILLILRRDARLVDRSLTVRADRRQRRLMDLLDMQRDRPIGLRTVRRTGSASGSARRAQRRAFGEGGRLAEARPPGGVELVLEVIDRAA